MKKAVIVTGTPGTGKTKTAKKCSRLFGLVYIDVNDLIKKEGLSVGFDDERECEIVDAKKLSRGLMELIKDSDKALVIDSHLSHYLPRSHVRLCIVMKCDLKVLKKRLEKRGYSEKKVRENLDSEIFDVCLNEALENGHEVIVVDSDKKVDFEKIREKI